MLPPATPRHSPVDIIRANTIPYDGNDCYVYTSGSGTLDFNASQLDTYDSTQIDGGTVVLGQQLRNPHGRRGSRSAGAPFWI